MHGFSDLLDRDLLTSKDIAERMGFRSWTTLYKWCQRLGFALPPRILGTYKYRGADVKAWFAALPTTVPEVMGLPELPATNVVPPSRLDQKRAELRDRLG